MTALTTAILNTLTYSDHFDFPLTLPEIRERLISIRLEEQTTLSASLLFMTKRGIVTKSGKYYHLPGRSSIVKLRSQRTKLVTTKLATLHPLVYHLSRVPGVLAIFLTGALAVSNSPKQDDFDLMIITSSGRLWTTRVLLTLYTSILGLRRKPGQQEASGKLCLNLYLDPTSLALPLAKRSLYTAYELVQAVSLYDPHHLHHQLLTTNSWVDDYLPNHPQRTLLDRMPGQRPSGDSKAGRRVLAMLVDSLEYFAYSFQRLYMSRRLTSEYITPHSAFFHPHNPGDDVLAKLSL